MKKVGKSVFCLGFLAVVIVLMLSIFIPQKKISNISNGFEQIEKCVENQPGYAQETIANHGANQTGNEQKTIVNCGTNYAENEQKTNTNYAENAKNTIAKCCTNYTKNEQKSSENCKFAGRNNKNATYQCDFCIENKIENFNVNLTKDYKGNQNKEPAVEKENRQVLKTIFAKTEGESPKKVVLTGVPFDNSSVYFTDIKIDVENSTTITPDVDSGYNADISAFDFLGLGNEQIFFAIGRGGSGGYGDFYVYDISNNELKTLFDSTKIINNFSARYADNYKLEVLKNNKKYIEFDLCGREDLAYMWDKNGVFAGDIKPSVNDVFLVQPTYNYITGNYTLIMWQKVVGNAEADIIGYIVTTLDLRQKLFDKNV